MTQRTVTVCTANLGRGGALGEFHENLRRLYQRVPGKHVFFGFQEIDEADTPEELAAIRKMMGGSHRFVGTKTKTPIAIPKTFDVIRRNVVVASEGVTGLSPRRHVVKAVVAPEGSREDEVGIFNTHFARDAIRLARARSSSEAVLRGELEKAGENGLASFLTADLNTQNFRRIAPGERRFVGARLDYVRGYVPEGANPSMELVATGSVNLTIDGHNAHYAKVRLTWK